MRICSPRARASRRAGLAPLELVLSLPLLLFVMALMVNFGNATCWKVRAATIARQAIWRDRAGWQGSGDPRPTYWPQSASMGTAGGNRVDSIDQYWDQPAINHPITRGPIITPPNTQGSGQGNAYIQVRDERLHAMSEGVRRGTSYIERHFPMLQGLGLYYFSVSHPLLDSRWQFQSMGYRTNETRRAKGWYNFEDAPEWASLKAEFQAADQAIRSNPTREDLVPLDRDQEFVSWYGSVRDFYPRVGGCGLDPAQVRLTQIINPGGLVSRIQGPNGGGQGGVPAAAARAFRQMYMEQIAYLQQQMPPPQQQIQALQQLVDQLNQFLQSLN